MRLLALDLERLGHFTNGRVTLAEPGSPSRLTLVHAPNEAGKTTILEGVRCFLFGFRERSGHLAHDGDQTTLKVRATFELGGHVYEARRRKGKKEQLVGTMIGGGSASIDDEWLRGKLSHPNREVFESVFAFSLDKLAQGAELLKGEQVKRAIYGAGFGGTVSPQRVLDDLRAKRELLFAERGHTRKIHQVAAKLVELEQLTSRATIKRDDELRIETELGAKKAAADERHARVAVLGRDNDRTAALRRSLEPWRSLLAAREELERLVVPPGLGVAEVESHRRAVEEHARNAADHREALEALDDAQSELDQVRLDPTILEASLLVEALYADLNAYRKAAEDHMKRVGELAQLHRGTSERLAGHRPTWTLEDLRTRAIDTRTRSDFNATVTQHETLEQDARRSEADRDRLNASIASLEARERAAPPAVDAAAARAWLADWSGFDSLRERVREAESSVRDLQKKSAITRRHLDLPSRAAAPDVERARVPPLVEVVRFDAELGRARDRVTKLDEQIAAARVEIAACDAELRTIEAAGHAPSEAELALGRARRDDGWRLVLRALANEADPVDTKRFDPERPLPRAYERAVTTADDLVDSMRRRADAVQQRAAKEAQKSRRVDEERTLVAAREQAVVEERALDATYVALWAGCDLVPLPPAAMRSWLAHHAALVEVVQDIDSGNERVSRLQEDANAYVVRGRRALDQDPLQDQRIASPDELRTRADARVEAAARRDKELAEIASKLDRDRGERSVTDVHLERLVRDRAAWRQRWSALMSKLGLEAELSVEAAKQIVEALVAEHNTLVLSEGQLNDRIAKLAKDVLDYEARVTEARSALASADDAADPKTLVLGLQQRLARAREAKQTFDSLAKQIAQAKTRRTRAEADLTKTDVARKELWALAGVTDDAAFGDVAERALRANELRKKQYDAERELRAHRGAWDEDAFFAALRAASPDALEAELGRRKDEIALLLDDARALDGEAAVLTSRLAAIRGSAEAADALAAVEAERGTFRADVERFAVLTVASTILENAIKQFERTHQSDLLAMASALFAEMTTGRFKRVAQRLEGELFVERANGDELFPDALSTGTKEQLFLALRLAYVQHYGRSAEPLPVVLDDVLVNFDDDRATATLRALSTFASSTQVLLFTCHAHLIALAESAGIDFARAEVPRVG